MKKLNKNQKKTLNHLKKLEEISKLNNLKIPKYKVLFDLKSTKTLGQWKKINNSITLRFHKPLLDEFGEKYILDVVTHEFAHLIAEANFPYKKINHGKEWKMIMYMLGHKNPRASTNNYSNSEFLTKKRLENKVKYRCSCRIHWISKRKHSQIKSKRVEFICKNCGKKIKKVKKNRD